MKRMILALLVVTQLLIGGAALSETGVYDIPAIKNQYYVSRGGVALITGTEASDGYHVEGRMLLQNITKGCLKYDWPSLYVYQHGKQVAEIPAVTVTPKAAAPKSFTLISFDGLRIPLDGLDGISLSIISNVAVTQEKEKYIGLRNGRIETYDYSDGLRISVDIADLKKGIYTGNLIVFDKSGRLVWAEDVTANREYYTEMSNAIQDREIEALGEYGLIPHSVCGEIYRKK